MSMIKVACGCIWSEGRKRYIKLCRSHLNQQIKNNIQRQNQINAGIIRQQALKPEPKQNTFHLKPLFTRKNIFRKKI
jgi:hypothetical protein